MNENDWPAVTVKAFDTQQCVQWSALRDVRPLFERPLYGDWCALFIDECEKAEGLDWKGACFARCKPDEVEAVEAELRSAIDRANGRFREYLSRSLVEDTRKATDLITLENTAAVSVSASDPGYVCTWP